MKLTAIDADTGRVLLSQAGSLSEDNFRKTVVHSFPEIEEDKIVIITDGRIQNRIVPKKRKSVSYDTNSKSVLWKGSFCLHPTTKIFTLKGIKEIKDVVPGDMVMTHKGRFRKVLRKSLRPWKGDLFSIRTALDREEILVTPNHYIVAIKGSPCTLRKKQTCKPTCMTQNGKRTSKYCKEYDPCHKPYLTYSLSSTKAEELSTNDFLFLPKLTEIHKQSEINICDYLDIDGKWSTDNEWVWPSRSHNMNKATIARKLGIHENCMYQLLSKDKNTMVKQAIMGFEKNPEFDAKSKTNRIKTKHLLSHDFGRILGLYAAEGSGKNGIYFSFNIKEKYLYKFVSDFIESNFGIKTKIIHYPKKGGTTVAVNSILLERIFKRWMGSGSYNKKIPSFIFEADNDTVTGFINGLWEGDGNQKARIKDNSLEFGSTSPSLVYGLRILLSKFDIISSVTIEKHLKGKDAYVLKISGKQLYNNQWLKEFKYNQTPHSLKSSPRSRENYTTKEGGFVKIKSIKRIGYQGTVYDLEVEEDHSYTANGKAVHNSDLGGYANLNREICMRLPQHGFQVKIEMLRTAPQVDPMTANILRAMENARIDNETRCPLVVGFTPMPVRAIGRKVIFYTMMETQGLHPEFAKRCNTSAKEIWVPCGFYADVFKRSGIIRPIEVLPLGVNHRIYTPEAKEPYLIYEEMPSGKPTDVLPDGKRFISIFGWSARKGPDILCRSFLEEFDGNDDAYLVIYSRYMGSSAEQHKEFVRNEIRGYYAKANKDIPARIFYCGDCIPINDLPGCYAAADAFVFCSRGEGFSLCNIEAASCGIPVVSSLHTGMTEYLDDTVAYCIKPEGYSTSNDLCWISGYYRDQEFAVMGDESVKDFRRAMRSILDDPKEAEQKSRYFKDRVLEKYTWDMCAERVARHLKE